MKSGGGSRERRGSSGVCGPQGALQDFNAWPPEEKSERDGGGGKKRGKKVLLAIAFSSGALGEAQSMAAVPVCECVCE